MTARFPIEDEDDDEYEDECNPGLRRQAAINREGDSGNEARGGGG